MSLELFNEANRAHVAGRRRSKDLLSGKVRCGLCGRVACIEYNERNEGLYRCKHRGKGCAQPARSAKGLLRAAVIALRVVKGDQDLQDAIREELTAHRRELAPAGPSVTSSITALRSKVDKLLRLYYSDKVSDDTFAAEEARLRVQIASLESEAAARHADQERKEELAERFEDAAEVLASFDLEEIWDEATADERRTIIEDLLDSVYFYPDQLMVQVLGAPPILVTLEEAGLRVGTRSVVSEGGRQQSATGGSLVGRHSGYGSCGTIAGCHPRCCAQLWSWQRRRAWRTPATTLTATSFGWGTHRDQARPRPCERQQLCRVPGKGF